MLYDGFALSNGYSAATAVYESATDGAGVNPCSLIVSSANGGFFAVVDAYGATIYQQPEPTPLTSTLMAGQSLSQVRLNAVNSDFEGAI